MPKSKTYIAAAKTPPKNDSRKAIMGYDKSRNKTDNHFFVYITTNGKNLYEVRAKGSFEEYLKDIELMKRVDEKIVKQFSVPRKFGSIVLEAVGAFVDDYNSGKKPCLKGLEAGIDTLIKR